jgi:hypothetical protein
MSDKHEIFGGDKHIVRSDCRLCCGTFGSVVFHQLIASLIELRDGWDHPTAHIHLMDYGLGRDRDISQLEIVFMTPTWADTEFEKELRAGFIDETREVLTNARKNRNSDHP